MFNRKIKSMLQGNCGFTKNIIAILLSVLMVFSLVACNNVESNPEVPTKTQSQTESHTEPETEPSTDTAAPTETKAEKEQREFNEYCDQLFIDMLAGDPMLINFTLAEPEKYGITIDEYTLGEFSVDSFKESEKQIADVLKELNAFDASLLTERQQLSLKTLITYFEKQDSYSDYYMLYNPFTSNSGIAANMSINFIEYCFQDEEDVVIYLALIKDTERYINEILDFVRLQSEEGYFMPECCADINIETCTNYLEAEINPLIASFEEKIEALKLPTLKKNMYIATNKEYLTNYYNKACQNIIDTLSELKGTCKNDKGLCWFDGGKEYYTAILKEKTSSDLEPEEIIELLDNEIYDVLAGFQELATEELLDQFYNLDFGMNSAEEILEFLADNVSGEFPEPYTKDFIVQYQNKAVEIEGTLAYYLTAKLDQLDYNSIKVNASAFNEDYTLMYSTLAHEGFPGHLYQYTAVLGNEDIPDVCKLVDFIGFTEGFAEYGSDRAYTFAGCSEELIELIVLNDLFGYSLQARVDLGIHYEGWDKEACAEYCAGFGIDRENSDYIFEVTVSDPGLIVPYAVGHIKMRNLREKAETELEDDFDAVEFHQLILDTGIVSFEIMEEELDKYIESVKK